MEPTRLEKDGLREKKRRDTLQRITEKGLELFIANGYEETTLDDITAAAGISRRTFFHYFKSKDEILLAWQSGLVESLRAAILEEGTDQSPLDALGNALLRLAAPYESDTAIVMARLLKSSDQLQAANQAKFLQLEQAAFEALCRHWPKNNRRERLRMIAMVGVGVLRVAIDEWIDEGGKRSLPTRLKRALVSLRAELDGIPD
ncbi:MULTISPECIES: TetR/AcrR family transcriptional regulator [Paraburkholderia]|uniref:TetR/AcrR family transcriptional regulator n=1 Tax=Paraburkholderia TaxID=1822464 RepID=UPI0028579978|nr:MULTISPECIES: helix-turn-helix domain-containing protein [Paraburkholderia]MDR6383462.1 AcrR family transcriptional regulator [Paraburkholderia caribensis]MDR6388921.1 AcrR family transcriptional regulator [Paraburkholderia phenoliruptrix]MDR6419232.1 AcrR family transcriptional regulator [Paraburkholderia phenoliruptrix]